MAVPAQTPLFTGGCLCGGVRFAVGAPLALWEPVPDDGLERYDEAR